jgi:AraC-like DNA-binding protein
MTQRFELIDRTRAVLREELKNGSAQMGSVAGRLALSERALRRQLSALGTSFRDLLDSVRREKALREMNASTCAEQLGKELGFAQAPAFYRAFRRWSGVPLRQYRAERTARGQTPTQQSRGTCGVHSRHPAHNARGHVTTKDNQKPHRAWSLDERVSQTPPLGDFDVLPHVEIAHFRRTSE